MKPKDIKELIDFIANSGLNEVNIETDEFKIHVKKQPEGQGNGVSGSTSQTSTAALPATTTPSTSPAQNQTSAAPQTTEPESSDNYVTIKSPMIGTFYRSPNPESDAFINVGDSIGKGKVVGIIEAMKLFNEIESEVAGKVVKVLVDDSSPVEYDQPLFLVDPS